MNPNTETKPKADRSVHGQIVGALPGVQKSGARTDMLNWRDSFWRRMLARMAAKIEARLKKLGVTLPALPQPGGNYLPARTVGKMVYLAGVISIRDGEVITGTVGAGRTIDEGYAAARACALIQLAVLKSHLRSLDKVKNIVTVNGYVNAVAGFPDSPKVINGASDLFVEVFGEAGRHARTAIGVSALPRNALVELQMTVEV
jgi:enamine deaminase RidA (YjgF/YER057c/UK114 family)